MAKKTQHSGKKIPPALRTVRYLRPYWYLIGAATIGGILKLTLPLLLPQVLKYFTDVVLAPDSPFTASQKLAEIYRHMILLLCFFVFVNIPAAYIREISSLRVSNHVMHTMRCQLYQHLLTMASSFHETHKSGQLATRISSDIEQVQDFIWNVATNIWIDALILVVYISLMASIHLPLTVLSCALLPISIFFTKKIQNQIRKSGRQRQEIVSALSGYFQEHMAGFSLIRLFHFEQQETQKFKTLSSQLFFTTQRQDTFSSLGVAVTASFYLIIQTIILCLSSVSIVKGEMTIGDMIVFHSYLGCMLTPLNRFAQLNTVYAKSMAGLERVYEILDTPPDVEEAANALVISEKEPFILEFRNVSFSYPLDPRKKALDHISFSVKEGQTIALAGRSGCGKTTIAHLIARLYDPLEGEILINGQIIRKYSLASLYQQISMVFQDAIFFTGTIADNLKCAKLDATIDELTAAAKAANAYEFIMTMPQKWNTLLGERGTGLSGGQKQRLAIARIFLRNPKFLILDEATSALDSQSESLVQEAIRRLMAGRTSIIIAHRLSAIEHADQILVMDNGRITEQGTHSQLIRQKWGYAHLYQTQ